MGDRLRKTGLLQAYGRDLHQYADRAPKNETAHQYPKDETRVQVLRTVRCPYTELAPPLQQLVSLAPGQHPREQRHWGLILCILFSRRSLERNQEERIPVLYRSSEGPACSAVSHILLERSRYSLDSSYIRFPVGGDIAACLSDSVDNVRLVVHIPLAE